MRDSSLGITRFLPPVIILAFVAACSSSDPTNPEPAPDVLTLTTKQIGALDSTGQVITQANPGNATLESLVDSTLLILTAGVQARRLDVTTNLTTKPIYFVGVHRAVTRTGSSFSTWTLVGMDDGELLVHRVEHRVSELPGNRQHHVHARDDAGAVHEKRDERDRSVGERGHGGRCAGDAARLYVLTTRRASNPGRDHRAAWLVWIIAPRAASYSTG